MKPENDITETAGYDFAVHNDWDSLPIRQQKSLYPEI